jgi:hypothetical protein
MHLRVKGSRIAVAKQRELRKLLQKYLGDL